MKKSTIPLLALLLCIAFPVFSSSLEELVGTAEAANLRTGQILNKVQLKAPQFILLPQHSGVRQLAETVMAELGPGLLAESLFLYKKPRAGVWTEAERAALYNGALKISSLAGIEYYSATRKKMRTFYEYSRVIDNPTGKKELDDPVYTNPPASLTVYARQKDLSFGDNIYEFRYITDRDYLIFTQENLTAMKYGIIPALGKGQLRSIVAVLDLEDSLLLYAASMAKAASFPGLGERIGNSSSNRAAAVLKWFAGQADKALGNE